MQFATLKYKIIMCNTKIAKLACQCVLSMAKEGHAAKKQDMQKTVPISLFQRYKKTLHNS